jgi:hypothetical protein
MYASGVEIEPMGYYTPGTYMPNQGLRPGEFFSHAKVIVQFDSPSMNWNATDDPNNFNQLDPSNPIFRCEQAVKINARMETSQGSKWVYDSDSKPVQGDFAWLKVEAILTLHYPEMPYLPWQIIKPYVGTINSAPVFGCSPETVLFTGASTNAKQSLSFASGNVSQDVTLEFAYQDTSWNKKEKPNGSYDYVHRQFSTDRIYASTDHRGMIAALSSTILPIPGPF